MLDNDGLMDHAMDRVKNRGMFVIDVDGRLESPLWFFEIVCQGIFQGKGRSECESLVKKQVHKWMKETDVTYYQMK